MASKTTHWYTRFFQGNSSDMWRRRLPLWHLAVYLLLAMAAFLLTLSSEVASYSPSTWGLLHIAFIGWYSLSIRYDPLQWREHQVWFGLYLLIGWSIWWLLVSGSNIYFMLLSGLFPHLFIYLKFRNAAIAAVILNTLVLLQLAMIFPEELATWLLTILITTTAGIMLAYFINNIIEQSRERRELIDTLQETRAQLAEAERLTGIAQERQRLAADLHDTLVQSLISVVTHLEAAENAPEQATHHLHTAKQAARDSLHDARQVIWDLRPPAYDADAFREALRLLCQQWKNRCNLPIEFTQAGNPVPLSEERQHTIIRVMQEALANISRHAQAKQVFVTLKFTEDAIKLYITDDGIGFDSSQISHGHGIENMQHRTGLLDGILHIESMIGQGTTITLSLPGQLIMKRDPHAD